MPALLLAGALAGCSGGDGSADPSSTAPATPSTSTATEAPLPPTAGGVSEEDAAQQYLALVEPYNESAASWRAAATAQPFDLEALKVTSAGLADANEAFITALTGADWPIQVQPTVEALAAAAAGATEPLRRLAEAGSLEDSNRIIQPRDTGAAEAQLLRAQLGLPGVEEAPGGRSVFR